MGFCHFASVSHSHSKHHLSLSYPFWPPVCVHWRLSGRERGRFQSRSLQWAAVSWRSIQLPFVGVYLQWCVYIYIAVLCLHNGKSTAFFLKTWLSFQCSCSRPWCDWFFFPFPFFFFFNLSCSFIFLSQKFLFFFSSLSMLLSSDQWWSTRPHNGPMHPINFVREAKSWRVAPMAAWRPGTPNLPGQANLLLSRTLCAFCSRCQTSRCVQPLIPAISQPDLAKTQPWAMVQPSVLLSHLGKNSLETKLILPLLDVK